MSQILIEDITEGSIFHLKGQFIGGDETESLRSKLNEYCNNDKNKVVINLEKVTYLNSTALGVFITANNNFIRNNGKIILCNISKPIENIIVMTKLNLVFTITENTNSAINLI
ncbi:MAG: STAS domain-containing protein [Candidatus Kapabacteria bacterium]|nr:STAS domain-containing protein [Candidatus Kapabacteria bacterium]